MSNNDLGLAFVVIAVWGVNFVALRLGLANMPPMLMVFVRFMLSAFPAVFFLRRPNVAWRYLIIYGLCMGALQATFLYSALKLGMPAGLSSVIAQTQAFFTLGMAALILKERVRVNQVVGMAISVCGLAVIALRFDQPVGIIPLLLVLASALSWGVSNLIVRLIGKVDMLPFVVWSSLAPPLPMLALSIMTEGTPQIITALSGATLITLLATLYTAYLSTVLGYTLWTRLIGKYGAGRIAPFSLLVPFFGLSSTAIILGEAITPMTLLAGGLILTGLAINVFGGQKVTR